MDKVIPIIKSIKDQDVQGYLEEVRLKLVTLADMRPAEIAEYFETYDIQGQREKNCFCPVAKFLKESLPESLSPFVGVDVITIFTGKTYVNWYLNKIYARFGCPLSIREFISLFDSGAFPYLEEK